MKIENGPINSFSQLDNQLKKTAKHAASESPQPTKQSGDAFSVELSSNAEQLSKPSDPDEISRDRVAAIRDQLASGTYNIIGNDVANKILAVLKK